MYKAYKDFARHVKLHMPRHEPQPPLLYTFAMSNRTIMLAGVPVTNQNLYHRIRFAVGDSAVFIETTRDGMKKTTLLVRDIEMDRARKLGFNRVGCAADFEPAGGLSGDRDTAIAQAAAECLRREGVERVAVDRSLPMIFVAHLQEADVALDYDPQLGVMERRVKDEREIEAMRRAQQITEQAMRFACETIGRADADRDGVLRHDGELLTSERLRRMISVFLLERGFSNVHDSIVATLPHVADCHHHGEGPLRTGLPVIIDIFPRDDATRYWGDCTRTVVHGEPTDALKQMHATVVEAKAAAIAALRPGATGEQVHDATAAVITQHGFAMGPPPEKAEDAFTSMRHGTGHGIGLDVHEPILLDRGAPEILAGEVFTVEPGLYSRKHGGVRVEDMVLVTDHGPVNFDSLPEGLAWV